jgi:hypothetical protein
LARTKNLKKKCSDFIPCPEESSKAKRKIYKSSNNYSDPGITEGLFKKLEGIGGLLFRKELQELQPKDIFLIYTMHNTRLICRHLLKKCPLSVIQIQKKINDI